MKKLLLSAVAATALMTLPALAQAPASNPSAATVMSQQQISNLWRASKLDGVNIYNNSNEKIGEIGDVLIDHSGKAMAIVVDVGGFLGMGEHRVALKFEDVKFSDMPISVSARTTSTTTTTATTTTGAPMSTVSTERTSAPAAASVTRMYPDHAILNMTKDQLKALPQISYTR